MVLKLGLWYGCKRNGLKLWSFSYFLGLKGRTFFFCLFLFSGMRFFLDGGWFVIVNVFFWVVKLKFTINRGTLWVLVIKFSLLHILTFTMYCFIIRTWCSNSSLSLFQSKIYIMTMEEKCYYSIYISNPTNLSG